MTPAAVLSILVKTQGVAAATGDLGKLDKAGRTTAGHLENVGGHAKRASGMFRTLGGAAKFAAPLLGGVGLAKALGAVNSEYRESQKTGAQTKAVLKSTGDAAKVSQKHVENLANSISKKVGIDDEAIQSSENMLLTFKNVHNEAGKGNKIFDQATRTVTDMSVALGQSGKSSAIQLGKALNDPIKGITALRRVGVTFDDDQKKQITTLVKHGDTLKAQKIILRELTAEFGGSAAAQATAGDKMKVALGNLAEAAGRVLVPAFDKIIGKITPFIQGLADGTGAGGRFRDRIVDAFNTAKDTISGVVGTVRKFLKNHKDDLDSAAHAARNVGAAIKWGFETIALPIIKRVLPVIAGLVTAWIDIIKGALKILTGLLTGDFRRAWDGVKDIFKGGIHAAVAILKGAAGLLEDAGKLLIKGLVAGIKGGWDLIKGAASWLKDKVVGAIKGIFGIHSPSTVFEGLGRQMIMGLVRGLKPSNIASMIKSAVGNIGSLAGSALHGAAGLVTGNTTGASGSNQKLGRQMMLESGWPASEWPALRALWTGESGWNERAKNASSGAYGIPQSLPASKMASAGADYLTSAATQIRWGLGYIRSRYGSPSNALAQWQARSPHWYAKGTKHAAKGLAVVGEKGPELVNFRGGEQVLAHGHQVAAARAMSRGRVSADNPLGLTGMAYLIWKRSIQKGFMEGQRPSVVDSGSGEDPNQALIDATNALAEIEKQRTDLETTLASNQLKIIALAGQGDQLIASVIAAVNGGLGRTIGLGQAGLRSPAGAVTRQ